MDFRKRVILVFLALCLFLVALKLSIDFPTGLGVYYGNTSATNPEGTIRFSVAPMINVVLISPPDNTVFTVSGTLLDVSFVCRVSNLSPANITQVKLYTNIFGPFGVTQIINVSGSPPHTVTFNVLDVPLGVYQWNCEGLTSTGLNAFAPVNWRFTVRTTPPTPGGGGGGRKIIPPPVVREAADYPLPCVIPPFGLKSWWTFDEHTDDFWNESNTGIPASQPRFVKRSDDVALLLDGKNDYVRVSPVNAYDSLVEGTIDGWVDYKSMDDYSVIFSYSDPLSSESAARHMQVHISPWGFIGFEYRDGRNYRIVEPERSFNFKNNRKWAHFALAYENGVYEWYINGVSYGSKTLVVEGEPGFWFSDLSGRNDMAGLIGAGMKSSQMSGFFRGAVDEVEIFDRALDFYEVNAIYSRSKCKVKPREMPAMPLVADEPEIIEVVAGKTRVYQPVLISPIPWWLLLLALIGVSAVLLAYYKGVMKKRRKAVKSSAVLKKKKKK